MSNASYWALTGVSFISFVLSSFFYLYIFRKSAAVDTSVDKKKILEIENQTRTRRPLVLFSILLSLAFFFFSSFRLANMEDNYCANVTILWIIFLSIFSLFAEGPKMYKYIAPR